MAHSSSLSSAMLDEPIQNVHRDLVPHIHLLCTFRYPTVLKLEPQEAAKWLLAAPKIARDTAPFFWTYLDCPHDGAVYLTWHSRNRAHEFASDGYIWYGSEVYQRFELGNGLILECFTNGLGCRMGEQWVTRSRRRYRLNVGSPSPNLPTIDQGLFLVHYGPPDPNNRVPINTVLIPPVMQQTMNRRQQLLLMGHILRKEFMLSDRVNWPHIPLPSRGQSMYVAPMAARGVPQSMAYPPHGPGAIGPAPKRRSQVATQTQVMGSNFTPAESAPDDDEDVYDGDLFDRLSPRALSLARYQQNHEWMEEVLSSPYRFGQIEVTDLGLGLRGALASITDGIFEAQGKKAESELPKKPYTGRLDEGLADEFRKRTAKYMETTRAEIEEMKSQHAKNIADLKGNTTVKLAERELRDAEDGRSEFWRREGRLEGEEEDFSGRHGRTVDEIQAQVEAIVGKRITIAQDVQCIQDGGYPPVAPTPLQHFPAHGGLSAQMNTSIMSRQPSQSGSQDSGVMVNDSDIDMGGTAAALFDQVQQGYPSTSMPQPHSSLMPSNFSTHGSLLTPLPHTQHEMAEAEAQMYAAEDVRTREFDQKGAPTAPDQGTGSGEWIVVPKEGIPPGDHSAAAQDHTSAHQSMLAAPMPGDGLGFDENNDFSSLGDLDTAGDALAGYDHTSASNLDDLNMEMEDSAFGDAFHGVERGNSEENMPANM